jgi:hypothetical protein
MSAEGNCTMTNRVVLDNVDHHDLRVALRHGAAHGDAVNQALLLPSEFAEAQRDFPILFRRDSEHGLQAVALLGLDRDENLFLEGDRWTSRHIPLLLQRGPFSLGTTERGDGIVHIDLDDPRVGAADGAPLFLPQGGSARYLEHITRILGLIRSGAEAAPRMYAAFDALGLLQQLALGIAIDDERRYTIPDMLGITSEGLAALGARELELLNSDGYLESAFLIAASLGNVQRLIERKLARAA